MTDPQFHAIIVLLFVLHLIQVMTLAEMMRRLIRIEKALDEMYREGKLQEAG